MKKLLTGLFMISFYTLLFIVLFLSVLDKLFTGSPVPLTVALPTSGINESIFLSFQNGEIEKDLQVSEKKVKISKIENGINKTYLIYQSNSLASSPVASITFSQNKVFLQSQDSLIGLDTNQDFRVALITVNPQPAQTQPAIFEI